MAATEIAAEMESVASRIHEVPQAEVQAMLRKHATVLRCSGDIEFNGVVEVRLRNLSGELGIGRDALVRTIVSEWLEGQ